MSFTEIIIEAQKLAANNWGLILIVCWIFASLIEIAPIKIYPLKYIKKKISIFFSNFMKEATKEDFEKINNNIEKLNNDICSIKVDLADYRQDQKEYRKEYLDHIKEQKIDKIKRLRKEILNFADEISERHERSKQSYEEVLFTTYPEYEELITFMGMTNGLVDSSVKFIEERYEQHLRNGDFILDDDK